MRNQMAAYLSVCLLLIGCSTTDSSVRGTEVRVQYAEILRIERVAMPSAAPAGAIVGGFTGLVLSRRASGASQIASGIGGAVLGGLATKALEGERRGYSYHLRYLNGDESKFITEKGYLAVGDCVAIESSQYHNMRRVASTVCDSSPKLLRAPIALHVESAQQCSQAKQQLLIAQGEREVAEASRKVEVICHF